MSKRKEDRKAPTNAQELGDEQLDDANGGIIAILIGLKDPKPPVGTNSVIGDGSVRTS